MSVLRASLNSEMVADRVDQINLFHSGSRFDLQFLGKFSQHGNSEFGQLLQNTKQKQNA